MENNSIIKGTLNLDDLPFLKDYDQLKTRLSIRLNSPTRVKPDAVTMPFRDLSITFHIDVSDVVGKENASCTINTSLLDSIRAEKERLLVDSIENSVRTRPAVTMPIEKYMGGMGFPEIEEKSGLMIATTEGLAYGAAVVLYPGFLKGISGGKDLYLIPSSVHEWLYIEDTGEWGKDELTGLLRAVNREVVEEKDFLSDDLYCWKGGEFRRA
jgi:hypothetical protein